MTRMIVALAMVCLGVGCGGASCESVCDRAEDLGCGSPTCVSSCEDARETADRIGCSGEFQAGLSCAQNNACEPTAESCPEEQGDIVGCVSTFCARNPSDSLCTGSP